MPVPAFPINRPPLPAGIRLEENVRITMRDGVKLAVDVYKPEREGRYPAIVALAPYKKEGMAGTPLKEYHSEAIDPALFVPRGYVLAFAQCRGSGMSQGQYTFYSKTEQQDGYDLIEGIAAKSWCNGEIGMTGGSYLGKSTFYTAAQRPPHLRCIAPYDAGEDLYRDFAYQGGGMYYGEGFCTGWGARLERDCIYPGPVEGKLLPFDILLEILEHYLDGPYWWERSPIYYVDKIVCPVLNIVSGSGWLHSRGHLACYQRIRAEQKLIIGPNANKLQGPLSAIVWENRSLNEYLLRWFDHWLKGIDMGIMKEPPVVIYDDGKDEWRYENEYPLARTVWTKFYLHSNPENPLTPPQGLIGKREPEDNEPPFTFKAPRLRRDCSVTKPPLAFATPAMEMDLKLAGPLSLTLYGSAHTENTRALAWFARLGDVSPDGVVTLITKGNLKASFRELDGEKSGPGQPFHPFLRQEYVEADQVYEYEVELQPIFHTFTPGHKVWLQISSDDPNWTITNKEDAICEPLPSSENSIYHDRAHPSHLLLPVIPDAPLVAPVGKTIWDPEFTRLTGYPTDRPITR